MRHRLLKAMIGLSTWLTGSALQAISPAPNFPSEGIIDQTGKLVLPTACDRITALGNRGWFLVQRDRKSGFLNIVTGQETGLIFDEHDIEFGYLTPYPPYREGWPIAVRKDGKDGYVDLDGRTLIPFQFDDAWAFDRQGLARVREHGKFGFVNRKGDYVIPPQFDGADDFGDDGLARVQVGHLFGLIDLHGRTQIPVTFPILSTFSHGLAVVGDGQGHYGAIDGQGKLVIPMTFSSLSNFSANGLARAAPASSHLMGFINREGQFVIVPQYETASDFDEPATQSHQTPPGLAIASIGKGQDQINYFIDARGTRVASLPLHVMSIRALDNHRVYVWNFGLGMLTSSENKAYGIFDIDNPAKGVEWFANPPHIPDVTASGHGLRIGYTDEANGSVVIFPQFAVELHRGANGWTPIGLSSNSARSHVAFMDDRGKVVLKTAFDGAEPFMTSGFALVWMIRHEYPNPDKTPCGLPKRSELDRRRS